MKCNNIRDLVKIFIHKICIITLRVFIVVMIGTVLILQAMYMGRVLIYVTLDNFC